jgi:hypothetical protein
MSKYLTAEEAVENAPKDLVEKDVEDVFCGTVRVRSHTAAQAANLRQFIAKVDGRGRPAPDLIGMEREQFRIGVIEPKFSAEQVLAMHLTSGPSFARVIEALDEISGTGAAKDAVKEAEAAFPDTGEGAE